MKVTKIRLIQTEPTKVIDCFIDQGYLQGPSGSLPDVDVDFESLRRQDVKQYTERRYNHDGKQRVFSAGTFTTLKMKAAIKDVARTMRIPPSIVNYFTAIINDDKCDYTGIFMLAAKNKKIAKFISDYPQLFEDIRTLLFQPRSGSIHASALLITPDEKDGHDYECFDFTPIKKVDDMLVSDFDGVQLDELGLLKNDCLATKELSKLHECFDLCNQEYNANVSLESIVTRDMDDPEVFAALSKGYTQNVFQFSSAGMTKFLMSMKPSCFNDLVAANALFRPATLENGSVDSYVDCKHGLVAPVYLWGTYEALKETYGEMVYQEQISLVAREVGGFSLGEGVNLVKCISKKKVDKIHKMHDKFLKGAISKKCPKEDAEEIWHRIESAGSYCFNKCISGEEQILRTNTRGGQLTVAEMYYTMHNRKWACEHGHQALHSRYKTYGYGAAWSMNENHLLVKNNIKDIRYMGIRPVYRITLENGLTLDVTDNHKHPTLNGKKRTDELIPGVDQMFVNKGAFKSDTTYRFTDKGNYNNERYHSNDNVVHYKLNSQRGIMGFTSRVTGYTQFQHYKQYLKKTACEQCGVSGVRLEVHHINGDHSDCGVDFSNLITLCPSCHKKAHYQMGRTKIGEKGLATDTVTVVSVEYIGEKEVFDIEMCDPYHTFVTRSGIVTCNSHATAYAATAYAGAWLKVHYPTVFYTVALEWADDDEIVTIMGEMAACSEAKVVPPEINVSGDKFYTDYSTHSIFWSLSNIKMVGTTAVAWIIEERKKHGPFLGINNFIDRIFKYKLKQYQYWDDPDNDEEVRRCPVNARHICNLIFAGCFDKTEQVEQVTDRMKILTAAASRLGFELKPTDVPEDMKDKNWWWEQQQIKIAGIGAIDYKRVFNNSAIKENIKGRATYQTIADIAPLDMEGRRVAICATVASMEERTYKSRESGAKETFCKLVLQQNTDVCECIIWSDEYKTYKDLLVGSEGHIIIFNGVVKYSDYTNKNNLQFTKKSLMERL